MNTEDNVGFRLVPVNGAEVKALAKLSEEMGISEERVFLQSLRFYELCRERGYLDEICNRELSND